MEHREQDLDLIFGALADPVRRAIIARLAQGDASVGELAAPFPISLPAVSRHLRVLEQASIIRRASEGRNRRCQLRPEALARARDMLDHYGSFWARSFDRLAAMLEEGQETEGDAE